MLHEQNPHRLTLKPEMVVKLIIGELSRKYSMEDGGIVKLTDVLAMIYSQYPNMEVDPETIKTLVDNWNNGPILIEDHD